MVYRGVRISDETYIRLLKLKAMLTAKNGKARTFDDIIRELLDFYEKQEGKVS
ncbi:MAG: hypothetical protein QXR61_03990 [Candidatus Bathyarchaeia archaeon]